MYPSPWSSHPCLVPISSITSYCVWNMARGSQYMSSHHLSQGGSFSIPVVTWPVDGHPIIMARIPHPRICQPILYSKWCPSPSPASWVVVSRQEPSTDRGVPRPELSLGFACSLSYSFSVSIADRKFIRDSWYLWIDPCFHRGIEVRHWQLVGVFWERSNWWKDW